VLLVLVVAVVVLGLVVQYLLGVGVLAPTSTIHH
jgi:hypothetical protein